MLRLKLQERAAIAAAQKTEDTPDNNIGGAEPKQTMVPDVAYGAPTETEESDANTKLLDFEPTESYL